MSNMTFAEYLKLHRKRSGISSKELAKMVGKGLAYVSQIENGRNKNPDFQVAYNLLKIVGVKEDQIENILLNFEIISPERVAEEQMIDDEYARRQEEMANDQEYQEYLIEQQIEWLEAKENNLISINDEIHKELSFFIKQNIDIDTFNNTIGNLHSLVMSMRKNYEDYHFFTQLFKRDIAEFSDESKKRIIQTIKEEFEVTIKNNGGFGKPPSF
jgi:transcriptional regulator with XRE-family HTH domain